MHLILFDVDGTLIKGQGLGRMALERAFAEVHRVDAVDHPAVRTVHFAGNSDPFILADMARVLGVADADHRSRLAELEAAYIRHLRRTVAGSTAKAVCPGVPDLLERLSAHPRLALGLLTGNMEAGARVKLDAFDLNRFFPFGGFGGDGDTRAEMALKARERAEAWTGGGLFAPADVLVVGDTVHDVAAGRENGFLTAAVATGWAPAEALRDAGPDALFPDLTPAHGFLDWLDARWNLSVEPDPV